MDVSDEILDEAAVLFYENIRCLVVVFLTVSILIPLSYIIVTSRQKKDETFASKDDISVHSYVVGICAVTITLSVIMVLMLPLSIIANEILILFPDCYYVQWINAGLLHNFFVFVKISFKGACVLIPFGFFFLPSHSMYRGSKAVYPRFIYSLLYVAVTYIALFGILVTVASTIGLILASDITIANILPHACFDTMFFFYCWPLQILGDFICCIDSALVFVQQAVSYAGLGLLLICIPSGIRSIIIQMLRVSTSHSLLSPSNDTLINRVTDEIYQQQLTKCLKYIKNLNEPFQESFDLQPDRPNFLIHSCYSTDISHCLPLGVSNMSFDVSSATLKLKRTPLKTTRSLFSSLAFLVLLFVLLIAALYTTVNAIALLCQLCIPLTHESVDHSSDSTILLGRESVSKFGFFGASLQVYFFFSIIIFEISSLHFCVYTIYWVLFLNTPS